MVAAEGVAILSAIKSVSDAGGGGGGSEISPPSGGSSVPSLDNTSLLPEEEAVVDDDSEDNRPTAVNIYIAGNLIGDDEYVNSVLIPAFEAAITDRDYVLVGAESRNAAEIVERTG